MMDNSNKISTILYTLRRKYTVDTSRYILIDFFEDNQRQQACFYFSKELEAFCIFNELLYYIENKK